jgi:ubiquinone/menaquinone biosynthesis C-methylase UbiE
MNAGSSDAHAAIHYYDGDYPSPFGVYAENLDEITEYQGVAADLKRYQELARGQAVLEVCCGTGRVAIALGRAGIPVLGVDISTGMLRAAEENLARESEEVRSRVRLVQSDVTALSLGERDFSFAICAFNSLLCIPSFAGQRAALSSLAAHLRSRGRLALDVVNPTKLQLGGDPVPKPFFTRRNPHNGRTYTRFAMASPFDAEQRQKLHGWYDELDESGVVHRRAYEMTWRPIFRFELELMLREAGFSILSIEGGHRREKFGAESPRMFVVAEKSGS